MNYLPLASVSFIMKLTAGLWIFVAVALILIVLVQKGKGGGLSAAFGGAGAGGVLGTKATDFFTKFTIVLVLVFLMLAIVLAKFYKPQAPKGLDAPMMTPAANTDSGVGSGDQPDGETE
jgi:preprotein translocase subunit SecG